MVKKTQLLRIVSALTVLSIIVTVSFVQVQIVYAAALSNLSDNQSSLKVNTLSDHTIQFVTPSGLNASGTIAITFPAGYTLGQLDYTSVDLATSTSASCSGFADAVLGASQSNLTWGVSTSSQTITLTSGTAVIPANRCIQIEIGSNATSGTTGVSRITNPSSATTTAIAIVASSTDTGTITQNIITDDTVVISAIVAQSISFTLSTTTIYFGVLGVGSAKFASSTNTGGDGSETIAHTLGMTTNAPSGYSISIRGQTLTSQQNASNTIAAIGATVASSSPNSEQFGIRATSTGGTGATIDATFAALTSYGYDATATTSATFATGSSATNQTTFGLRYVANVAGTTEAGTYTASVVYVATANF